MFKKTNAKSTFENFHYIFTLNVKNKTTINKNKNDKFHGRFVITCD